MSFVKITKAPEMERFYFIVYEILNQVLDDKSVKNQTGT